MDRAEREAIRAVLRDVEGNKERAAEMLDCVIYEDKRLLVVNKPAGVAVHGGSGISHGVVELLRHARPDLADLGLVHRIDRETSGCLVLAKRRSALRELHERFREGDKAYKKVWFGPAPTETM